MRKLTRLVVPLTAGLCAAIALSVMILMLSVIVYRGAPSLSWQFFTQPIQRVGAAGGIFYNLIGTLILIATAAVVCIPLATGLALTHSVYIQSSRSKRALGLILYALNAVPSILFGIIGLIVFVKGLGLPFNLWPGA